MTIAYDLPKLTRPPRTSKALRVGSQLYLSRAHAMRELKIGKHKLNAMLADGRAVLVSDAPVDGKTGEAMRILKAAAMIREDAATEWEGDELRTDLYVRRRNLLKAVYYFRQRHGHGLFDNPEGA